MKPLTIGLGARNAGVGVETVRFYERQGLIEELPGRPPSGYREYDDEVVSRLGFIRRAKELGFTLKEIKGLLSLRRDPSTPAGRCETMGGGQDCTSKLRFAASKDEKSPGRTDFGLPRTRNYGSVPCYTH